jgi:Flp pilus assembly pilin Flp
MIERFSLLLGHIATLSQADAKAEDGQTTVEYAVVLVLVVIMAIAVFATLQGGVSSVMTSITNQITSLIPV